MAEGVERLVEGFLDQGSLRPHADGLRSRDPLGFPGYGDALEEAWSDATGDESVVTGAGTIDGHDVEAAAFDFRFFGGSMGEVAGERLAQAMERAAERKVPFVLRTATGGARMQEGMRSLVQMAKVIAARQTLAEAHSPFIVYLGHPTTGGVLASLAALADLTIAEEGATIGFAGPRVAERFVGQPLSGTSHSAETALVSGLVDEVLDPGELREYLASALATLAADETVIADSPGEPEGWADDVDAWEVVRSARSPERPPGHQLMLEASDSLVPLRGDRQGSEDAAVDVALARVAGGRVMLIALDRERAPRPAGYRKARRAIEIASRLAVPIVTLVDTRGADPSEESESSGIAWEIARLFDSMLAAPVPTISIVTGEGGSGGALAFCVTDCVLAYEGAIFSVIGPEMAAEILWRDPSRAPEAARALKLTAPDLLRLGIANALLTEPPWGGSIREAVAYHLARLQEENVDPAALVERRLKRWRNLDGN